MLLLLLAGAWGPLLHPPACQRLRDIPAPLFRPGNHPLSRLPGEAVSGGNGSFPERRRLREQALAGPRGTETHAGSLRAGPRQRPLT